MNLTLFEDTEKNAIIDSTGTYRYSLSRMWDITKNDVLWIMLNPSIADASVDDPTIRRCIGFAKQWDCGSIEVVNLFAYRATNPDELLTASDPVGPCNDFHMREAIGRHRKRGDIIVCAWGTNAGKVGLKHRIYDVLQLLPLSEVNCLEVTRNGYPKHPLYCRADLTPTLYEPYEPKGGRNE